MERGASKIGKNGGREGKKRKIGGAAAAGIDTRDEEWAGLRVKCVFRGETQTPH